MKYNYCDGRDGLIKILKVDLGWECGNTNLHYTYGDYLLELQTPIHDLNLVIVGNLLFPDEIDLKTVKDPLSDPRGIKNLTIVFYYKKKELYELIEQKEEQKMCSLFLNLFNPLENKDPAFKELFPDHDELENDDFFENLNLNDIEIFVDRLNVYFNNLKGIGYKSSI